MDNTYYPKILLLEEVSKNQANKMFLYLSSYQAYWSSLRGHYEKDNKIIIIIIPD